MRFKVLLLWVGVAALLVFAYDRFGWAGLALGVGALLMWLLLHFTRLMHVMKRAANRPLGHVESAVMLNAKLQQGRPLLHVVAMTRALGERLSPEGAEPEVYRWRDGGGSSVSCEFEGGKLQRWKLERPAQSD
ncbi:MAG: hypothetical protein RLZZ555_1946 [Pseudomonadota bacterium]|jgi:hypothetical protein